jgi:hypothetical protein
MNQLEKDLLKRLALFIGFKLALYIFIARAAKAARRVMK